VIIAIFFFFKLSYTYIASPGFCRDHVLHDTDDTGKDGSPASDKDGSPDSVKDGLPDSDKDGSLDSGTDSPPDSGTDSPPDSVTDAVESSDRDSVSDNAEDVTPDDYDTYETHVDYDTYQAPGDYTDYETHAQNEDRQDVHDGHDAHDSNDVPVDVHNAADSPSVQPSHKEDDVIDSVDTNTRDHHHSGHLQTPHDVANGIDEDVTTDVHARVDDIPPRASRIGVDAVTSV
jgi:hypothetical protein